MAIMTSSFVKYFMLLVIVSCSIMVMFTAVYTHLINVEYVQIKPNAELSTDVTKQLKNSGDGGAPRLDYSPPKGSDVTLHIDTLLELARETNTAAIHARSMKTIQALKRMEVILTEILNHRGLDYKNETKRKVQLPKNVCPEKWMGGGYSSPLHEKSFKTLNCTYGVTLPELISIVYLPTHDTFVRNVLDGITKWLPGVTVYLGSYSHHRNLTQNIIESQFSTSTSYGSMLNTLISHVKTKYVFIAHNLTEVDEYVSLKRLVRAIETVGVSVASGSSRDIDGHWRRGCFQRAYSRYSLVYQDGYDESAAECLICDDVTSSFVIETLKIRNIPFDEKLDSGSVFKDLFIKLGLRNAVVCPDVMFHIESSDISTHFQRWKLFARKWEIHRIKLPFDEAITIPCSESNYSCDSSSSKHYILHPCCRAELSTMIQRVNEVCNENSILCEIADGTALGAVKFSDILPWEVDADVYYHLKDFKKIVSAKDKFNGQSFKFHCTKNPTYDKNGKMVEATHMLVSSRFNKWFVEVYGIREMTSDIRLNNTGKPRTKMLLDGHLVHAHYNPGLAARGRYGLNIYKHAQNWRVLRTNGWQQYPTGQFVTCPIPGNHKCLDNMKNDGDIQISDPLP